MKKLVPTKTGESTRVSDVCTALDRIAPTKLAQEWDNVGLLVGDPRHPVQCVLACIDLTSAVVDEAVRRQAELILAYHPPIFRPIKSLRADAAGTEAIVFECIRHDIAVYAVHTALDAAEGGTNDVVASLCGLETTEPLTFAPDPAADQCKLVAFVPAAQIDRVADAAFGAGAGRIGDYTRCSFRLGGHGTFLGGKTTRPWVGERERLERVDEIRFETIVPSDCLAAVINAVIKAHPYEEPAFDVYPLKPRPVPGIGRIGRLSRPITLVHLARKLKRATGSACVQIVGPPDRAVSRIMIHVGAARDLPFRTALTPNDVIVTGEIRHHDAVTIERIGCMAVALGHWASERPVLPVLAERLIAACPGLTVHVSDADRDPFGPV